MNIKWEDGLKLDSKILLLSDSLVSSNSNMSNMLPFNLSKGSVSFRLEYDSLDIGLILITKLLLYINDKKFISFDNEYPLSIKIENSPEVAPIINLYLNINKKMIELDGIRCIKDTLSLSDSLDLSADESVQIGLFRLNNTSLEPLESDFPILTMDHYLMKAVFLKLKKMISNVENYNRFIFSTSQPYMASFLEFMLRKINKDILFSEHHKDSTSPKFIYDLVYEVFSLLSSGNKINKDILSKCMYEFDKAYSKINFLIDEVNKICLHNNIKNFVQFHRQGQKYVSDDFPLEFFSSKKFYFVIKKKNYLENDNGIKNEIKITSISRYTKSVVLSLPGIKLRKIDKNIDFDFNISVREIDTIYEIESNSEWDFILVDKSATFSANDNYDNYEFFFAFI